MPRRVPASNAETATLTVKLVLDNETYENDWGWIKIIGHDYLKAFYTMDYEDPTTLTVDLPKGDYVVISEYNIIDTNIINQAGGYAWIVKEVSLDDNASITIDPAEATNRLTCNSTNPDGEAPMLPTLHYSSAGMEDLPGNISEIIIDSSLAHSDFGPIFGRGSQADFGVINENEGGASFDIQRVADIHVNDLSDKFTLYQERLMAAPDGFYFTAMKPVTGLKESADGVFEQEYPISYIADYKPGLNSALSEPLEETFSMQTAFMQRYLDLSSALYSKGNRLQVAGWANVLDHGKMRFMPGKADYAEKHYDAETGEEDGVMTYYSRLQGVTFDENLTPSVEVTQLLDEFCHIDDPDAEYVPTEGHPAFSFACADAATVDGDCQPTILFNSRYQFDWDSEELRWYLDAIPAGRRGELLISAIKAVKRNETESDGKFRFDATLANNIVDGIEGHTEAYLEVNPDEDICAPVLQLLQFRSTNGRVTDRFDKADEGFVRIAAGDFNQQTDDPEQYGNSWFELSPATITVEYSPLNADRWQTLAVTERPEMFVKQFGYTYEGSLADVDTPDYTGWYDMRVTLTDANGSLSQQTVSPAFKIGEHKSALPSISATDTQLTITDSAVSANGEIAVFDVKGNAVARGYGNVAIDRLPRGVYIVRAGAETVKIVR